MHRGISKIRNDERLKYQLEIKRWCADKNLNSALWRREGLGSSFTLGLTISLTEIKFNFICKMLSFELSHARLCSEYSKHTILYEVTLAIASSINNKDGITEEFLFLSLQMYKYIFCNNHKLYN